MTETPQNIQELETILDWSSAQCKRWLACSLVLKFGAFLVAAMALYWPSYIWGAPIALAVMATVSEICLWRSDYFKGESQSLLRKLDFRHSFGWQLDASEVADLRARISFTPKPVKATAAAGYFASLESVGPQRAAENLCESAWWSKHLAWAMFVTSLSAIAVALAGSCVALIASINLLRDHMLLANVSRIAISGILLLFSLGLVKFAVGYFQFWRRSERAHQIALGLSKRATKEVIDVLKAWNDYHVSRATAPVLPSWLWRMKRDKLNRLWAEYVFASR